MGKVPFDVAVTPIVGILTYGIGAAKGAATVQAIKGVTSNVQQVPKA